MAGELLWRDIFIGNIIYILMLSKRISYVYLLQFGGLVGVVVVVARSSTPLARARVRRTM